MARVPCANAAVVNANDSRDTEHKLLRNLRIVGKLEMIGTFKQRRSELVRAGYNLHRVKGAICFNDARQDPSGGSDEALFERIQVRQLRA